VHTSMVFVGVLFAFFAVFLPFSEGNRPPYNPTETIQAKLYFSCQFTVQNAKF
jgi:hypothetical protein